MYNTKVSDVILSSNTKIHAAIEAIDKVGVRGTFICDEDNELLGIVMDSDIRKAVLSNFDLNASIKTIMKTTPFVIQKDVPVEERRQLLISSSKLLVPIVDEKRCVVDFLYLPYVLDELFDKDEITTEEIDNRVLPPQRVLVIGGAGYIGSVLVTKLLRKGYQVRVLDILLYGKDGLQKLENENLEFIRGDCRDKNTIKHVLKGVDAVIHLGEIVGDPACSINEQFTIETNYSATQMIVEECMKMNVKRFLFASSCSVYGHNDNEVNEESEINPVSLYARCKVESEKAILSYGYNHFCPMIFRIATVHGISHRQRFDLVVNFLTIKALSEGKIKIFGGEQWRPFISVQDICHGVLQVLWADRTKVKNEIFNLGDTRENHQMIEIGRAIKEILPEVEIEILKENVDNRNYKVSFEKIKKRLGFTTEYNVKDTIKDLARAYRDEGSFHDYIDTKYHNFRSLKY